MNTTTELERLTQEYEDLLHDAELARRALEEYKAEQQREEQQNKEFEALMAHVDCYNRAHGTNYTLTQEHDIEDYVPGVPLNGMTFTFNSNWNDFAAAMHKQIKRYEEEN